MGIFSKDKKEDKKQQELKEYMEKYNLDTLSEKDTEIIKKISSELSNLGLIQLGTALKIGKAEEIGKMGLLSVLVEQNWLIIKKLDEISNKLDK